MVSRPNNHRYIYLVSSCLAGIDCTYNGKNNSKKFIKTLVDNGKALPVCPEVMGGLGVPRDAAEIQGGGGKDVLIKRCRVLTISGKDVSRNYIKGAIKILQLVKKCRIKKAILKSNSPACGLNRIYDGTFTHSFRRGDGVLTAILKRNNIKVYSEKTKKY